MRLVGTQRREGSDMAVFGLFRAVCASCTSNVSEKTSLGKVVTWFSGTVYAMSTQGEGS